MLEFRGMKYVGLALGVLFVAIVLYVATRKSLSIDQELAKLAVAAGPSGKVRTPQQGSRQTAAMATSRPSGARTTRTA